MRALVISGGGSKGAWGGGAAEAIKWKHGGEWKLFVGTSTGSLLTSLIPVRGFPTVKIMYTNVSNENIYSLNPYTKKGNINYFNAIWRVLKKEKSLGEAKKLQETLYKYFSEHDYDKIINSQKEIVVTATNMTNGGPAFFSTEDLPYDTFMEAIMASVSVPVLMPPVTINNCEYSDGGLTEHVPIKVAIEKGATEIDVIVLRPEKIQSDEWKSNTILDIAIRSLDVMQREISMSDVEISKLLSEINKEVTVNIYYTPYELCRNSMIFDKEQMTQWWSDGFNYILKNDKESICRTYQTKILKSGKTKVIKK